MQIMNNQSNKTSFGCSTCRLRVSNFAQEHKLSQGTTKTINAQLANLTMSGRMETKDGQVILGHFPIADYFLNWMEKQLNVIKASTPHKVDKAG
jgi:hypothetical protein